MIRLEGLSKKYMTDEVETWALNDVSLEVGTSEFVAVTGPSGGGKSTLLNIVGLLDNPSVGRYFLRGKEIATGSERSLADLRRRSAIGFIFQNFNLIDDLTVAENVAVPLFYRGVRRAEHDQRVKAILERMGILHRSRHFPRQLSGGQQQRVAIARALVFDPALVLADEPTGNLDSANGDEVIKILSELAAGGTTVVMVTHFEAHWRRASRVIHMVDGGVVRDFRPN